MYFFALNKQLATVAMLATMSALSWTNTASANIEFIKTQLPSVKPGDQMTLNWNIIAAPPAGTVINTAPFNLFLRALSGQRYLIRSNVAQELLTVRITVPTNATGGLHSYLCDYNGNDGLKGTNTGQFNISGPVVATTTTRAPTSTEASATLLPSSSVTPGGSNSEKKEEADGLSSGALAGIIGGVVAFFLFIAAIFFFRHRRLVRERNEHTRLDDTKESIHEAKSSVTARSGPPPSGPPGHGYGHGHEGEMVPIPLGGGGGGGPRSNEFPRNQSNEYGSPRSQHQMQHLGSPGGPNGNNNGRNPFEAPEDSMTKGPPGGGPMSPTRSLSPRDQHQPYMPPQLNQGPPPRQQQPPYGMPNNHPGMQQRGQSPFQQSDRDSFESELESAYDPNQQARMMQNGQNNNYGGSNGPVQRNNSNAMMHGGAGGPLQHSSSSRSMNSNGPRQNMSPGSPHHQHQQQQQGNPFQDRELMAAAAGGAATAHAHHGGSNSPSLAHRQLSNQIQTHAMSPPRGQSPMLRAIEMQPLDVQQHQYEQQQRALQRQQQQKMQQQQQQQQPVSPVQPLQVQHQAVLPQATVATTSSASASPPAPGAHPFNPTLYDDKTEVDDDGVPVYNGYRDTIFGAYVHTPGDDDDDESGSDDDRRTPVPTVPASVAAAQAQAQQKQKEDAPATANGGATIERKKSVKFTGVPASGPIVVPETTAAPTAQQKKPQQQMYHSGDDEDEDEDYEDADEEDIKLRLMETEVPSPSSAHSRPAMINTSSPTAASRTAAGGSALSPIRSPTQAYNTSSSQYQSSQKSPVHSGSPSRGFVAPPPPPPSTSQSDNFFDDVLAAVDNKSSQPQQSYVKPAMAPLHVEQAVFGAPSPRIAPAAASNNGHPSSPSRSGARPIQQQQHQTQQQRQQRHGADDEEAAFYESSLL